MGKERKVPSFCAMSTKCSELVLTYFAQPVVEFHVTKRRKGTVQVEQVTWSCFRAGYCTSQTCTVVMIRPLPTPFDLFFVAVKTRSSAQARQDQDYPYNNVLLSQGFTKKPDGVLVL